MLILAVLFSVQFSWADANNSALENNRYVTFTGKPLAEQAPPNSFLNSDLKNFQDGERKIKLDKKSFDNFGKSAPKPPPLPPQKRNSKKAESSEDSNAAKAEASREASREDVKEQRYRGEKPGRIVVEAASGGASTLGEYFRMIPRLVEEQEHAAKAATRFEATVTRLAEKHGGLAQAYAFQRNEVARSETNLGALGAFVPPNPSSGGVSGTPAPVPSSRVNTPIAMEAAPKTKQEKTEVVEAKPKALDMLESALRSFSGELGNDSSISAASDPKAANGSSAASRLEAKLKRDKMARNALREKLKRRSKLGGDAAEETEDEFAEELAEEEEPLAPTDALISAYEEAKKDPSFSMLHSETEEYIDGYKREVASLELPPEVLDEESDELFKRVNEAHRRSLKRGDVKLAAVSKR